MISSVYMPGFYRAHEEGSEKAARAIVPTILDLIKQRSVVDVGCGTGICLAIFRELGVEEILGLDGAWVGEKQLRIPRDRFIVADLTKPLPVQREFDLVVSLEVAEHLPPPHAETFVESLTRLGPVVLFLGGYPIPRRDRTSERAMAGLLGRQVLPAWISSGRCGARPDLECRRHSLVVRSERAPVCSPRNSLESSGSRA